MKRGLETLAEYSACAETQGVDKLIAVATSAVREAGNGEDFLERVGRTIGFWPKAISGEERRGSSTRPRCTASTWKGAARW